jgi:hypothetical protein
MKHAGKVLGVLSSSLFFVGCSAATPPDPGVKGPTVTSDCNTTDQNPYGVCYPTQDMGSRARSGQSVNAVSGARILNYAFSGYKTFDVGTVLSTGTLSTVRLADFFDPQQKLGPNGTGIKIIHVVVSAVWCNPCNQETDFVSGGNWTGANTTGVSWAKDLAPLGVVFLQALDDGATVGVGATPNDLNNWINHHQNDFTTTLDPGNQNLGIFFDAAAIPFNMNIDARSMEILSGDVGFDTTLDQSIKGWVNWVNANPAKQ